LFLEPAWYYRFWRKQYVFLFSIFISLDFLIFHIWPAPFWEHIVHMFWCCLKALRETRVDWKLSVLLKWVARELELNSCHTLIELLSFINYFPCHLEQEWCHGLERLFVGCIRIQCLYSLLVTTLSWSFKILFFFFFAYIWVIPFNVVTCTSTNIFPSLSPFQWLHPACLQLQWKIH
jgi:hypothetical protein